MNSEIDPCIDFYEYSCGGWIRTNSMSDDESRADTYSVIRNQMSEKLKRKSCLLLQIFFVFVNNNFHFPVLLEEPITEADNEAIRKVKNFYLSCVDTKLIEQRAERPLLDLLDQEFGGWSLIGRETEKLTTMDWVCFF